MDFFKKDKANEEKAQRLQFIMAQQPDEKYRKPGPLGNNTFPNHNFIEFKVNQCNQWIKLHVYRYPPNGFDANPDGEPKSIVFIFHGLNGHVGRYAHIAKELSEKAQCAVVGFDHRGFGRSEGFGGWVESEQQHLSDSMIFIHKVHDYYKNLFSKDFPMFLSGQSMGGMTAYALTMQDFPGVKGTILLTPALKDNEASNKFGKSFAKMLGGVFPRLLLVSPDPNINMSDKNPQANEESQKDPYIYRGKIVPGTIKFIVEAMEKYSHTFGNYKCPFLVITGGMDKLVDPDIGQLLMKESPSLDKQLIFKENMWHNAINEEEIYEILPVLVEWVITRQ